MCWPAPGSASICVGTSSTSFFSTPRGTCGFRGWRCGGRNRLRTLSTIPPTPSHGTAKTCTRGGHCTSNSWTARIIAAGGLRFHLLRKVVAIESTRCSDIARSGHAHSNRCFPADTALIGKRPQLTLMATARSPLLWLTENSRRFFFAPGPLLCGHCAFDGIFSRTTSTSGDTADRFSRATQ